MTLPLKALEFLNAGVVVRRNLIRCGFELETQASGGGETELDEDAYYEAIGSHVEDAISSEMSEVLNSNRRGRALLESVREVLSEHYMEDDEFRSEYERSSSDPEVDNSDVERGIDGSVRGYEFRTRGGLNYRRFMDAARDTFWLDHTIDTRCSFHVHLSIPGVEHRYGANMQRAMVEYIALNVARFPASVQERFRGARGNTYICGLVGKTDKYQFVRFHPQGTWEFRCIGNVQDAAEAKICLDICIEALAHGYAVVAGQERLYWRTAQSESAWIDAVFIALGGDTSVLRQLISRAA